MGATRDINRCIRENDMIRLRKWPHHLLYARLVYELDMQVFALAWLMLPVSFG